MSERIRKSRFIFVIGTTAELIKCFPVINRLTPQDTEVWFSGQQPSASNLLDAFLNEPNPATVVLTRPPKSGMLSFILWSKSFVLRFFRKLRNSKKGDQHLGVVVHGDTVTALLAAVTARVLRIRVFHIEAGLRSHSLLSPFPEELNRRALDKICHVHFAPDDNSFGRLALGAPGRVYNTKENTALDAIREVHDVEPVGFTVSHSFALISLHRTELLSNKKRLIQTFSEIQEGAQFRPVVIVAEPRLEAQLDQIGFLERLAQESNIQILPKLSFPEFQYLLRRCCLLITDSGGQQAEASLLKVPSLIHRKATERNLIPGLIEISGWEIGSVLNFLRSNHEFSGVRFLEPGGPTPSNEIARVLRE